MKKTDDKRILEQQQLRVQRDRRDCFDETTSSEERGLRHRETVIQRNDYIYDED